MGEDRVLQVPQLDSRLETQLAVEELSAFPVGLEGLRLAAGAVEREHQEPAQPFAKGVLADKRFELGHQLRRLSAGEVGLDALFERRQA